VLALSDGRRSARAAQRLAPAAHDTSAGPRLPRRRCARPNNKDKEKEAITMAKQTAAKNVSAKQVAIDILRAAAGPLKAKEIAKRVIDSGRCSGLKGKTPEATISAMLAVGSKPGGQFKRVDKWHLHARRGPHTCHERRPCAQARAKAPDAEARGEAVRAEAAGGQAKRLNDTEPRAAEAEREPLNHWRLSPLVHPPLQLVSSYGGFTRSG